MRECIVEDAVTDHAEATGWLSRKIKYVGRRGARDRDFYGFGNVVLIEFKRPGRDPDAHQQKERKRLAEHGVTVHVIDDIQKGCDLLDSFIPLG